MKRINFINKILGNRNLPVFLISKYKVMLPLFLLFSLPMYAFKSALYELHTVLKTIYFIINCYRQSNLTNFQLNRIIKFSGYSLCKAN